MKPTDEMLMAYADDELDRAARMQVEAAIATDPALAQRVAAHRALRTTLQAGFSAVLDEPMPERLTALLRPVAESPAPEQVPGQGQGPGQVLPFRLRPMSRRPWLQWGSLAASFVLGVLLWQWGSRWYPAGPITRHGGELVAAGDLARALTGQLAANQSPAAAVRIGVSFLSRRGNYCRTFQLRDAPGSTGLACRQNDRWKLQVLAQGESPAAAQPQYRQAASALPAAVLQAVSDTIAGEPLDAAAEAKARDTGWRTAR